MLTVKLIDWYIIGIKFCFPKKFVFLISILASMLNVSISNTRFNARSLGSASDVQLLSLTSMLTSMLTSIIDVIFDIDSHANRLAKSVLTGTFARWQALFAWQVV